jgi:hypothetical protein
LVWIPPVSEQDFLLTVNTREPAEEAQEFPSSLLDAGVVCTDLIAYPKAWINRRVETTELLSHEETRRRVSIDFTLPDHVLDDLEIEDGVIVPISVLTKEARRNFDVRDEAGRSMPVLGKHQNGELAHIALLNAALRALGDDVTAEVFEFIAADLRHVVFAAPSDAENALGAFMGSAEAGNQWREAILDDPTCQLLLGALWANYVLFVVLAPGGPNRRVIKFSYGEDFDVHRRLSERLEPGELLASCWRPDRPHSLSTRLERGAPRASTRRSPYRRSYMSKTRFWSISTTTSR